MTPQQPQPATTGRPAAAPPAPRRTLGLAVALVSGAALAAQSRVNGELGQRIHDGVAAALVSFSVGLIALTVLLLALPGSRRGLGRVWAAARGRPTPGAPELRRWHLFGGLSGAYLVITQGTVAAVLGVAIFTVALVAGQSATSLLVDRLGLGPAGPQPVTAFRAIGAVLAVVAVLIAVLDRIGRSDDIALALLPAIAGLAVAFQQAATGRVQATAGSAWTAAFVNFLAGTIALGIALCVDIGIRGLPGELPAEPLLYVGGFLGMVFIGGAAWVVRWTGVLLFGMASVAGQLVAAVALDLALPASGVHLTATTYIGTVLTLVAVALAALPGRRAQRP